MDAEDDRNNREEDEFIWNLRENDENFEEQIDDLYNRIGEGLARLEVLGRFIDEAMNRRIVENVRLFQQVMEQNNRAELPRILENIRGLAEDIEGFDNSCHHNKKIKIN